MFSKNLRYFRLKNALTKKELARRLNVTPMAISNYENGKRTPSMEMLKLMAGELGVRVPDFLAVRNEKLVFCHGELRKNSALTNGQQEYVHESAEEYLNRFMTIIEILGGDVLPPAPCIKTLELSDDYEANAMALRKHLNIAHDGPVVNLIGMLENKGILIMFIDIGSNKFSGMNGTVNGRPYIAVNPKMTTERNRSTIIHELAHLMFIWPPGMDDSEIERRVTAIGGAFLFPKNDVLRELGVHRNGIANDMVITAKEYGISMMLLATRAQVTHVITEGAARDFYMTASTIGWRTNEPSRIETEKPRLFEQLVLRAVNEHDISIQRGAELLKTSYNATAALSAFGQDI